MTWVSITMIDIGVTSMSVPPQVPFLSVTDAEEYRPKKASHFSQIHTPKERD